ncbi:hypothetical protein IW262DRAFT_1456930 [Armillaria fumosa]|nr:hypothetical protein IW262DRAFT_1456930 [Armillaria fumosa]
MAPETMEIARFKAALGLLCCWVKNGTYTPTIPAELLNLADGTPDIDAILTIDHENLHFLEGQPLFENKDQFMKAYAEEPILLQEEAFSAHRDTQNRKNQLERPYGLRPPDNPSLSTHATGWIHADQEEKAAATAATTISHQLDSLTKEKLKKAGKIVKSKATIRNETDLETNHVDEDVKMKGGEESVVLQIDMMQFSYGILQMSLDEEELAHPTTRSWTTCKHRCTKCAASCSPVQAEEPARNTPGDSTPAFQGCPTVTLLPYCDIPGLTMHDPSYQKAIELLEKQDRILAAHSNKCLHQEFQAASHGDPPKENLVFPIASWAANFMLTSKYETLKTALKTVAASHLGGDKLESLQMQAWQIQCKLELLVHCLESSITVYQFCLKQQELIAHKINQLSST